MRLPAFSLLLPALLLASCGTQREAPALAVAPSQLLTVNVTPSQSDADLTARYGGHVVLRTSTFAVIGDPKVGLSAQGLKDNKAQPNRGVMKATAGQRLWGSGQTTIWANGQVPIWAESATPSWDNGVYNGLPANTALWKSIGLDRAYQQAQHLGLSTTIAVIDSGVDVAHPMLHARLSDPITWRDFVDGDTLPQEVGEAGRGEYGHGTVVAGIAAQIAPNAHLMPLRVLSEDGSGDVLNVASAIVWAADHGADVINLSLGASEPVQAVSSAIEYANQAGVLVVAAAGNTGQNALDYPASSFKSDSLNVSVGSVNAVQQHSAFSAYAPSLQLNAPGELVSGPYPGNRAAKWTGTSMSAPIVAGALALGLGEDRTPQGVVGQLRTSAASIDAVYGNEAYVGQLGHGILDLGAYTNLP
ncbi:S8 family serine peptidase [Deinococcus hohokamensis]|uniref:S8 family serine peptidase n=1 Tax=Deinococcus hohokamensis TaxID=309883 RepID=A0ABV9I9N2_9DEIO